MLGLTIIAATVCMTYDAARIGYEPDDVPGFAPSPTGWLLLAIVLWPLALTLYVLKRPALTAAAARRHMLNTSRFAALSGPVQPLPQPDATADRQRAALSSNDLADGLRRLVELRDRGLLSESEFRACKHTLLAQI